MNRDQALRLWLLVLLAMVSSGCDLAAGIFKAGFTVGLLAVGLGVVLVLFLVMKARR